MIPDVVERKSDLEQLCGRYHVRRLELFGSAASGDFRAAESDLDFLVEFESLPTGRHADAVQRHPAGRETIGRFHHWQAEIAPTPSPPSWLALSVIAVAALLLRFSSRLCRKLLFYICFTMEAGVGIEPAYTELQSAA